MHINGCISNCAPLFPPLAVLHSQLWKRRESEQHKVSTCCNKTMVQLESLWNAAGIAACETPIAREWSTESIHGS
jgi:hypothetical protein